MPTTLPAPPQPDDDVLARGQARLLADLSRLHADEVTEASGLGPADAPAEPTHAPWLGPQAAWESAAGESVVPHRYQFAEVFARGGLGSVRRANDRKLGRTIAVKELLRFDTAAVQRFAREAAITARLQHPGIIPLHDLGRDELGRPFLCMKLVEGGSLEQRIAACADLDARLALLPHLIAAADAVAYAHSRGIIHRDLKPANILVGEFGEAVVIDWGLAKDLSQGPDVDDAPVVAPETISDLTAAGSLLGTIRYMPPEQARGEALGPASDVYALGAALYHLLAGAPPFAELRSAELLHAVLTAGPVALVVREPGTPRALAAIVGRAMQREPADRYAGADAFAEDLRRFVAGRLVGAHAYSPAELGRLWLRRHRGIAAVAAGSLLLLAGLGGLALVRVDAERDRAEVARVNSDEARTLAERTAKEAVAARGLAERTADRLRIQQARQSLEGAPAEAIRELAQLGEDPGNDAAARLLALAAEARGLPELMLHGPQTRVIAVHPLRDGTILAREHGGQLWRWSPGAAKGEMFAEDGVIVSAANGEHWARITREEIELHRAGEFVQRWPIKLQRAPVWYHWRLADDGRTVVAAVDLTISPLIIDMSLGTVRELPGADAPARMVGATWHTPAADGQLVAAVKGGELLVWDRRDGSVRGHRLPAAALGGPEFAADGRTIVVRCAGDRVLVVGAAGARVVAARSAVVAGDVLLLIAGDARGQKLWAEPLVGGAMLWSRPLPEAASEEYDPPLTGGPRPIARLRLADAWEILDAHTGAVRHHHPGDRSSPLWIGHGSQVLVAVPGEGVVHRIATIDLERSPWTQLAPTPPPGGLGRGDIAENGRFAVRQTRRDHVLERLDLVHNTSSVLPVGCGAWSFQPLTSVRVADDGRVLLTDFRFHACLWQGDEVHPLAVAGDTPHVSSISFAADGLGVTLGLFGGSLLTWDRPDAVPRTRAGMVMFAGPDGAEVVADDGGARLITAGREPVVLPKLDLHDLRPVFAPDGRSLALHDRANAEVLLIDVPGGGVRRRLPAPLAIDRSLAGQALRFSPSGQALALADGDRVYRWWLAGADVPAYMDRVRAADLAFTPDESALIVLDGRGDLMLVDPDAGVQVTLRDETGVGPAVLRQTLGGVVVLTATGDVLGWRDSLPAEPEELRAWLRRTALRLEHFGTGE